MLHASWNIIANTYANLNKPTAFQLAGIALGFLAVVATDLALVLWRFNKSKNTPGNSILTLQ